MDVDLRVLGPVELWFDHQRVDIGVMRQRCLFAVLLVEQGRVVPLERLETCLWDDPPLEARASMYSSKSRLNKCLAVTGDTVRLELTRGGYRLEYPRGALDLDRFEELEKQARAHMRLGDAVSAVREYREACALFRGEPLGGVRGEWTQAARARLRERARGTNLARIEAELSLGREVHLVEELTELAARRPVDESAVRLLTIALHRLGRTGEALAAINDARVWKKSELGLDLARELQEVRQRILTDDPGLRGPRRRAAPDTRQALDTLDPPPLGFVGRDSAVAFLTEALTDATAQPSGAIVVLDGMGGVGKTTLAVHVAHRVRDRFPDGCLQLDLAGYDLNHEPLDASFALALLLQRLGVEDSVVGQATDLNARAALWRRKVAGRRLLIILDNVRTAAHVIPLLPHAKECAVLVTTRRRLHDLDGTRTLSLDPMTDTDASLLLTAAAGNGRLDNKAGLGRLLELCEGLPFALKQAGRFLRAHAAWSVSDVVDRLKQASNELDVEDELTGPLMATLELSYQALEPRVQRSLRRLVLHPPGDISLNAAAALDDATPQETQRVLDTLFTEHLIDEPARGRVRLHSLVRGHALAHVRRDSPEATAATDRMIDYYVRTARQANEVIRPNGDPADGAGASRSAGFTSNEKALAWLDSELPNLLRLTDDAAELGRDRDLARLAHVSNPHLDRRALFQENLRLQQRAANACAALGDRARLADASADLAACAWRLGEHTLASEQATAALRLYRGLNDVRGESRALFHLGRVFWRTGRNKDALTCFQQCARLRVRTNDQRGLAAATYHLGIISTVLGNYEQGIAHTEKALRMAQQIGDRTTERNCLNNLGDNYRRLGRYETAANYYRRCIPIAAELGDLRVIAGLEANIAVVRLHMGFTDEALGTLLESAETHRRVEDSDSESETLIHAAAALARLGRDGDAFVRLRRATVLAHSDPLRRCDIHLARADIHLARGEHAAAIPISRQALKLAREVEAPLQQARAHAQLAKALDAVGQPRQAQRHLTAKAILAWRLGSDTPQRRSHGKPVPGTGALDVRQKTERLIRSRSNSRATKRTAVASGLLPRATASSATRLVRE